MMFGLTFFDLAFAAIGLSSVIIIAATVIGGKRKKVRQKRATEAKQAAQNSKFIDLLERAEAGDESAQDELVVRSWSTTDPERAARLQVVKGRRNERVDMQNNSPTVRKAYASWQKKVGTNDEIEALAKFVTAYRGVTSPRNVGILSQELGLKRRQAKRLLYRLVSRTYDRLAARMLEDRDSFLALRELIQISQNARGTLRYAGVYALNYPRGWDQAVAKHFRNPHVGDFASGADVNPGELRLMAAEALRVTDIIDTKRALAYANVFPKLREELGDVLTAELAKAVAAYHGELSQVEVAEDSV